MAVNAQKVRETLELVSQQGLAALDQLEALYHPNLQFQDPVQKLHDRAAYMKSVRRIFERAKSARFLISEADDVGDKIYLVFTIEVEPKLGATLRFEGAAHLRVEGGLIGYQRDYWDSLSSLAATNEVVEQIYYWIAGLLT